MITREIDYAIRVVLHLARAGAEGRLVPASLLAVELDVPYRFLRNVCRRLVKSGLVSSRRGNSGGLALALPPGRISLLDVMRGMDRKSAVLNRCLLAEDMCKRQEDCDVHRALERLQARVDAMLAAVRFTDL